jgi:hypothetical protein
MATATAAIATPAPIFQLKVSLEGIDPALWRRVQGAGQCQPRVAARRHPGGDGVDQQPPASVLVGERMYSAPRFNLDEFEDDPSE